MSKVKQEVISAEKGLGESYNLLPVSVIHDASLQVEEIALYYM